MEYNHVFILLFAIIQVCANRRRTMRIKTITTTFALSFLTAVSFADGDDRIDINKLNSTLDSHKVTGDFLQTDQTFKCVYKRNKKKLDILHSLPSYNLLQEPEALANLVVDLFEEFNVVPLDIVGAYSKEVINDSLGELFKKGIYLNDKNWLDGRQEFIYLAPVSQRIVDEENNLCKIANIEGPGSVKIIRINLQKATEFVKSKFE